MTYNPSWGTGGSGITDLTGDVTASGTGSVAATIASDVVTYAKLQNAAAGNVVLARAAGTAGDYGEVALAASQLLGRGASGNVAAIVLGASLSMSGTTLNAASTGWTEIEVDFGSTPAWDATFTVTDASVSATTEVAVVPSGKTATDRAAGDALWDAITYAAVPGTGAFTLYALATPGPVVGKRYILYQVGT